MATLIKNNTKNSYQGDFEKSGSSSKIDLWFVKHYFCVLYVLRTNKFLLRGFHKIQIKIFLNFIKENPYVLNVLSYISFVVGTTLDK